MEEWPRTVVLSWWTNKKNWTKKMLRINWGFCPNNFRQTEEEEEGAKEVSC